jgi:hypothetical protein
LHTAELESLYLQSWPWKLRIAEDERGLNYILNLDRVFGIWQVLESALDRERRETLALMLKHRPAMARNIMRQWAPPQSRVRTQSPP